MDTDFYLKKLCDLKEETQQALDKAEDASQTVELDQTMMGRLSRMDAMQQQEMALSSKRRYQQQLLQIEQAIKRIKEQEYGYCVVCDERIAEKRLALNPVVQTCIQCAQK